MAKKIVAIVGTYRRGRVIETAVDELLSAARQQGAEAEKVMLLDQRIEFCTNCRDCTQHPGRARGVCPLKDNMDEILDKIDAADGFVLASPINAYSVTAIMKRFIERLVCYAYWPWNIKKPPQSRIKNRTKRAVVITSSMCPAFIGKWLMGNPAKILKGTAKFLGAQKTASLYFGMVAIRENDTLSESQRQAARKQGIALARGL